MELNKAESKIHGSDRSKVKDKRSKDKYQRSGLQK